MLNSYNTAVTHFANKDSLRPVLTGVYFDGTKTVATDSYQLIEVETPKEKETDFPSIGEISPITEPVIIPVASLLKAERNIPKGAAIPILKNIIVGKTDKGITLKTTDLESIDSVDTRTIDGQYPKYESVFPTGKPTAFIKISAEYLLTIARFAEKTNKEKPHIILEIYDDTKPLVIQGSTDCNQKFRSLIMPLRMEEEEKNTRLPEPTV